MKADERSLIRCPGDPRRLAAYLKPQGSAPVSRSGAARTGLQTVCQEDKIMLISDVLRSKGGHVVKVRTGDSVALAVHKLAEHHIGAVVVEDRWMRPAGIFSERDFVNAIAGGGAAVLGYDVQQLMSSPVISCESNLRIDAALATMTLAKIRHLPVIENGELKGIVSIGDLVKHRLDEKELEASVLLELSRRRA